MSASVGPTVRPTDAPKVARLWDKTIEYGASIHSGPGKPDGRGAWQAIKEMSSKYPKTAKWSARITSDPAKDLSTLTMLKALEAGLGEDAHYFAQLLRIPAEQTCCLRRVLQVAFNIGQLNGSGALMRLGAVHGELPELYSLHQLGRLDTYCPDASEIDAQLHSMEPNDLYAP